METYIENEMETGGCIEVLGVWAHVLVVSWACRNGKEHGI